MRGNLDPVRLNLVLFKKSFRTEIFWFTHNFKIFVRVFKIGGNLNLPNQSYVWSSPRPAGSLVGLRAMLVHHADIGRASF